MKYLNKQTNFEGYRKKYCNYSCF